MMITRKEAKEMAMSRDCSCVAGKDRDNNFDETIDKIYDAFQKELDDFIKIVKFESVPRAMLPGMVSFVKESMEWKEPIKTTLFKE